MQDAVLIYLMLVNMRHSGYVALFVGSPRRLTAKCLLVAAAIARSLSNPASAAASAMSRGLRIAGVGTRAAASASAKSHGNLAIAPTPQLEWLQALTRLENYIASAA